MSVSFLHIYHTNDIHSHFEQWPKIVSFLQGQKEKHLSSKEDVLLVDIGDFIDRFHPISEATRGKGNTVLLNEAGYDYVTIGNNEGITLAKEELDHLYDDATFQVLVNNLFFREEERPSFVKPYAIHKIDHGIKIGVIGTTVPYPDFYSPLGWEVKDPFEAVRKSLEEIRNQVDIIVLLSHLGKNDDKRLAHAFPEIDVIIGAHTHHLFEHGHEENGVLLCCAEKYGHYVGHVSLVIDVEKKQVIDRAARTVETFSLQEASVETEKSLHTLTEKSQQLLNQPITTLKEPFIVDWFYPSSFARLLVIALKQWCKSDIAMVNAGILLESLPEGIVTKGDIHRICPHPINPCRVTLRGSELTEVIHLASTEKMEGLEIKGLGFRGKIMGKMMYDGVAVSGKNIFINGEVIEAERKYSVGTIDMFTFAPFFPQIRNTTEKQFYMPEFMRDVLAWKLAELD